MARSLDELKQFRATSSHEFYESIEKIISITKPKDTWRNDWVLDGIFSTIAKKD
jgi:hypothetical protein